MPYGPMNFPEFSRLFKFQLSFKCVSWFELKFMPMLVDRFMGAVEAHGHKSQSQVAL